MAGATGSHTMLASQASLNANPAAGNTNNNAWRSDVDTYYDYAFRVCIVGDSGVGKTSLVEKEIGALPTKRASRLARLPGVGIHFETKTYNLLGNYHRVQFWDSPGSERYARHTARYCAGCSAAILVYDVCSQASFQHLQDWLRILEQDGVTHPKVLIGNCTDRLSEQGVRRAVGISQAQSFAERNRMLHFETSAVTGDGVEEAFAAAVYAVVSSIPDPPDPALLLRRGISIGPQHRDVNDAAGNAAFRYAMFKASDALKMPTYPKDITFKMDWL